MTHDVIQPDGWAPARGYANGIYCHGRQLFVGGQIGWELDRCAALV